MRKSQFTCNGKCSWDLGHGKFSSVFNSYKIHLFLGTIAKSIKLMQLLIKITLCFQVFCLHYLQSLSSNHFICNNFTSLSQVQGIWNNRCPVNFFLPYAYFTASLGSLRLCFQVCFIINLVSNYLWWSCKEQPILWNNLLFTRIGW